jgi:S-adenosylmethionine-dependent methyltransferase
MTTSSLIFDNHISQWLQGQNAPWNRIRYTLVKTNLAKHGLSVGPWRILDAAGGTGTDSIAFALNGHHVDIVDYSNEMLNHARQAAVQAGVGANVSLYCSDIRQIPQLMSETRFDIVLCHNVLQYVADAEAVLQGLASVLKTGGLISVVAINRHSIPYSLAFTQGNLAEALDQVDSRFTKSLMFDTALLTYTADEIVGMLKNANCVVEADYGIRCMFDYWGDTERKSDPATFEQLERLELALTEKLPYKLLARQFQVVARKA